MRSLALAAATFAVAFAAAGEAAAQSCKIEPSPGTYVSPGTVVSFGDLKIRVNSYLEYNMYIDIKIGETLLANQTLRSGVPARYTICGQDVTLTYTLWGNGTTIAVSVF